VGRKKHFGYQGSDIRNQNPGYLTSGKESGFYGKGMNRKTETGKKGTDLLFRQGKRPGGDAAFPIFAPDAI
jgi:hypothetical protein